MVFISLGMSAVVPVSHALLAYGFERSSKEIGLNYLLGSGGLCDSSLSVIDEVQSLCTRSDVAGTLPAPSITPCVTLSVSTLGSSTSLARVTRSFTSPFSLPLTFITGQLLPPPRGITTSTLACAGATKSSAGRELPADRRVLLAECLTSFV